jgi:uncharacterized damage-inducible protein DinB
LVLLIRPAADEYAEYYRTYTKRVPEGEILELMDSELEATLKVLASVPAERETYRYEAGKWSIRETVGHMVDTERTFAYRALWFARDVGLPLPGMEQDEWAAVSNAHDRPLAELAAEFAAARRSHREMFAGFDDEAATRRGIASGVSFSVRSIAWILVGHEIHHRGILQERYL